MESGKKIDDHDRVILEILQKDARVNLDVLAEQSGLSLASAQRRLKRLRDSKIIQSEIAVIDPELLDRRMTFIVEVELERERIHELDEFVVRVKQEPGVQQCYYVTGQSDFFLICTARDMEDFERITRSLFFDHPNVRKFKTSLVMARKKVGLAIPI